MLTRIFAAAISTTPKRPTSEIIAAPSLQFVAAIAYCARAKESNRLVT